MLSAYQQYQLCSYRSVARHGLCSGLCLRKVGAQTCPVACGAVGIWEEVIRLEGPRGIVAVLGVGVGVRRGVEYIQPAILVSVVNQLVHVFEPAHHDCKHLAQGTNLPSMKHIQAGVLVSNSACLSIICTTLHDAPATKFASDNQMGHMHSWQEAGSLVLSEGLTRQRHSSR